MSRLFHQIIKRPVSSEKSYAAMGALNKYTFEVDPRATKIDVWRAVEEAFADQKITVTAVNTVSLRGKVRQRSRRGARIVGNSPKRKKAIVTLAPGQKIEGLFEGI